VGRGGGGTSVQLTIVNNAGAQVQTRQSRGASGGVKLDVLVDKMVGEKVSTSGTASNRAVRTFRGGMPLTRRYGSQPWLRTGVTAAAGVWLSAAVPGVFCEGLAFAEIKEGRPHTCCCAGLKNRASVHKGPSRRRSA
jgi:hypothetical protein